MNIILPITCETMTKIYCILFFIGGFTVLPISIVSFFIFEKTLPWIGFIIIGIVFGSILTVTTIIVIITEVLDFHINIKCRCQNTKEDEGKAK